MRGGGGGGVKGSFCVASQYTENMDDIGASLFFSLTCVPRWPSWSARGCSVCFQMETNRRQKQPSILGMGKTPEQGSNSQGSEKTKRKKKGRGLGVSGDWWWWGGGGVAEGGTGV